jgi:hypothetical protein
MSSLGGNGSTLSFKTALLYRPPELCEIFCHFASNRKIFVPLPDISHAYLCIVASTSSSDGMMVVGFKS